MATQQSANSKDWVRSNKAYMLAWGWPHAAIIFAILLDPILRAVVWSIAAAWMGTACLMNSARCGRTHCRYTGPYYIALVVPVVLLGTGVVSAPNYLWWILAAALLLGGKAIWLITETLWGRYRTEQS